MQQGALVNPDPYLNKNTLSSSVHQAARLDKVGHSDKLCHNTAVPTSFVVIQEKELLLQQSLLECTWHVASSVLQF
jgi:hypothetical protein